MIELLLTLTDNDGLTLKNGKPIKYKTGYQVATLGMETTSPALAAAAIANYGGNCGVWFSDGKYYIDQSQRVATKRAALALGKEFNQQSILKWTDMSLIWL